MATKLDAIEAVLCAAFGEVFLQAQPELIYGVNRLLLLWGREEPSQIWDRLDSCLFNAMYAATGGSMSLLDRRIRAREIREAADRLLALCYAGKPPEGGLQGALFDLARAGAMAAMRELLARYPLEDEEREMLRRVLLENGGLGE